jgi:hypothetical protein
MAGLSEYQCAGGCGRERQECATSDGADFCADLDDYRQVEEETAGPLTWERFEAVAVARGWL